MTNGSQWVSVKSLLRRIIWYSTAPMASSTTDWMRTIIRKVRFLRNRTIFRASIISTTSSKFSSLRIRKKPATFSRQKEKGSNFAWKAWPMSLSTKSNRNSRSIRRSAFSRSPEWNSVRTLLTPSQSNSSASQLNYRLVMELVLIARRQAWPLLCPRDGHLRVYLVVEVLQLVKLSNLNTVFRKKQTRPTTTPPKWVRW